MNWRENYVKLEKVVATKQLRLAVETEEERKARLENDAIYVYKYSVDIYLLCMIKVSVR